MPATSAIRFAMIKLRTWIRALGIWSRWHPVRWGLSVGIGLAVVLLAIAFLVDAHKAAGRIVFPIAVGAIMGFTSYVRARHPR